MTEDAEAIAEAASRPTMRFVELKSEEQLDMQTLHRARERLVGERTALINQLRAILLERGVTVAQGRHKLQQYLTAMLDAGDDPPIGETDASTDRGYARRVARTRPADHRIRQRVRRPCAQRCRRPAAGDHPRYRSSECDGAGGRGW